MEQYGFARNKAAGEYCPRFATAVLAADVSVTGTTFVSFLSANITLDSTKENIVVIFHCSCRNDGAGGNTPTFQLLVDGVVISGSRQTNENGAGLSSITYTAVVTGLQPGTHTCLMQWRSANTATVLCNAVSNNTTDGANLIVLRDHLISDREMSGVGLASWPGIYTCGSVFSQISSTVSDSNTTPVTLLQTANITTREPNSALLIRFDCSGTSTTGTATVNASAKFQVFVDGVGYNGTGGLAANAATRFSTGIVLIAGPFNAGNHKVDIYWGGGAGSSITPSNIFEGARLTVKEVFCPEAGNVFSDMGGYPALYYSAFNVPQVRYARLTTNVTGTTSNPQEMCAIEDYVVSGDNSVTLIESTFSCGLTATGASAILYLQIDYRDGNGYINIVRRSTYNFNSADTGIVNVGLAYAEALPAGSYRIRTALIGTAATCDVQTHPEYNHNTLVIREMNKAGAYIN